MENLLAQQLFSYPIYRADTTYRYRKIGTPTVFEELLMHLANQEFPQLANNSLAQISKVLKLDFIFIRHTLENLNDIGLIERIKLPKNETELNELPLSALRLTDNGKKFHRSKKMPGRRRTEDAEFWFNPLNQEYVGKPKTTESSANILNLDNALFPVVDARLQELGKQEAVNQKWFDAETELEHNGVSVSFNEFLPQNVSVNLVLDHNRYLDFSSNDKLFNEWLIGRDPQIIKDYLLDPMLEKVNKAVQWDVGLDYPENGLLWLGLANQTADYQQMGNTVAVQFDSEQQFDQSTPLIMFADVSDAQLHNKQLIVPTQFSNTDSTDSLTCLFYRFSDNTCFVEETGYLNCYFNHQPYLLPVKMLYQQNDELINATVFNKPNKATLAFMANFVPSENILDKLPRMTMTEAKDFAKLVKGTWGKDFSPKNWANKITALTNQDELSLFTEFFPETILSLIKLSEEAQRQVFDWAIDNEKSPARKIPELSELLALYKELNRLNTDELELKDIKLSTLQKISQWQESCEKTSRTFSELANSKEIANLSEQLKKWQQTVYQYFEPFNESDKFAVLDTNFIRNNPNKLSTIKAERRVILPKTILDELDSQKEKVKKELNSAKQELTAKKAKAQNIELERGDLQIQDCDTQLTQSKHKQESKKRKAESECNQAEKTVERLEREAFEIREAIRQIEELKLADDSAIAHPKIVQLMGVDTRKQNRNSENDQAILAVAARYKLNDVLLYSEDKNLKNQAVAIGIQTA